MSASTLRKHVQFVNPGDIIVGFDVVYVCENLHAFDGGCVIEGISLTKGVTVSWYFSPIDHLDVLA